MLRQVLSVGGLTLVSRAAGFVRDVLTAGLLGAGPVADAFFVAFRIPNHFRALFAEGAFNAAFVPAYAGLAAADRAAAHAFARSVAGLLLASQFVLLAAFLALAPAAMVLFAPGFAERPGQLELAAELARICFPYLLFVTLVTLLTGMLNGIGRFAAGAAAPIVMNLALIAALLVLPGRVATVGHALAWGVFAAGVAQLLLLAAAAWRAGILPGLGLPRFDGEVRGFFARLLPAALGAGAVQISLFLDTVIASFLPAGGLSYLYYADRLNQLPLAVVGIAVGTVLLPELSRLHRLGEDATALERQNRALEFTLLLALPAAAVLALAAEPLMRVLFQRGAFGPADAAAAGTTLAAYALGLPAFVLVRVLAPGFQGRGDTATPVRIAVLSLALGLAVKLALVGPLAQVGLALGTAVGGWLNAGLLALLLARRGLLRPDARLRATLPRLAAGVLLLAAALLAALFLLAEPLADPGELRRAAALAMALAAAGLSYALALAALGLHRLLRRRR